MAVGQFKIGELFPIAGIKLASGACGIKKNNATDLVLMEIADGASVAAVFTKNQFCAAPVILAKEHLRAAKSIRYLVINSGNANAATGEAGMQAAKATTQAVAQLQSCDPEQVLPFSTGVIGQILPAEKIETALPQLMNELNADAWDLAAKGIMTTDTYAKAISSQFEYNGQRIHITGIAKGVGMVNPNMATVLVYVATDAKVPPALLNQLLKKNVDQSINAITVDGDTSTNDSCVLIATGKSGCLIDGSDEKLLQTFDQNLNQVMVDLAHCLIKDGEGATKFVTVNVIGAPSEAVSQSVANQIANSPLVKTALFASDPNWGRIIMAIGNVKHPLDVSKVGVSINDITIVETGGLAPSYQEEEGVKALEPEDIVICVNLNQGDSQATVWTTDLSYEYIKINAEYRT